MTLFLNHYHKLEQIGRGANAQVYKVRHADLGYIRAIKVLKDDIDDKNDKLYQSFLKECRTLLTIGNGCHPNIVRIYGPDLIDNHAVVEMDYIHGTTLDAYIKKKIFIPYEEVQRFMHDIVGALAYTHHDIYRFLMDPNEDDLDIDPNDGRNYVITPDKERELIKKYGIVHNDLHSNNVMRRDYDGNFVLLDFGLAVQDGKCVKSSRMADGSPEYQAPEKFDSDTVGPCSDVYSLGILLYEMLAGRVPFQLQVGADGRVSLGAISAILDQHKSATPEPILPLRRAAFEATHPGQKYERDYPEWLEAVIMKCLAKKPEDRYADARELMDEINSHTSTVNVSEPDAGAKSQILELQKQIKLRDERIKELEKALKEKPTEQTEPTKPKKKSKRRLNWLWNIELVALLALWLTTGYLFMWNGTNCYDPDTNNGMLALSITLFLIDWLWLSRKHKLWRNILRILLLTTSFGLFGCVTEDIHNYTVIYDLWGLNDNAQMMFDAGMGVYFLWLVLAIVSFFKPKRDFLC